MRFLSVYKTQETTTPPTPEYVDTMQRLVEEGVKAGWLLSTEGCLPSSKGARVKRAGGTTTVTDGPFTETKELIAGFAMIVDSLACRERGGQKVDVPKRQITSAK